MLQSLSSAVWHTVSDCSIRVFASKLYVLLEYLATVSVYDVEICIMY